MQMQMQRYMDAETESLSRWLQAVIDFLHHAENAGFRIMTYLQKALAEHYVSGAPTPSGHFGRVFPWGPLPESAA
ncbi:GM22911 [Drosophila sechellia]|uniref:GM22911 n=1 Tax=Drosophila sechellia TaxID=7238 RepID=B4I6V7_DROSE|nr:GM22911 [Drosophila sechellia]